GGNVTGSNSVVVQLAARQQLASVLGGPVRMIRVIQLIAADFGASNSVEHASTRAELGYDSPGRVTNSLGNSSRRFHESTFESATVFTSASGSARNFSAHKGASAVTTANSDRSFAIFSTVLPSA